MRWKNRKPGVVVLGRWGIVVLVVGMSLLVVVFFLFGVHVGRHIDVMPEKIAWGIPRKLLYAMNLLPPRGEHGSVSQPVIEEARPREDTSISSTLPQVQPGPTVAQEPDKMKMSETREGQVDRPFGDREGTSREEKDRGRDNLRSERYRIQIVSLRDRKKAEEVAALVKKHGYHASVVTVDINSKGRWYRVVADGFTTEDRAREAAAVLMKKLKSKCIVMKAS